MSDRKQLMIVHPDAATDDVREVLSEAGFAMLVSEHPEHFKPMSLMPVAVLDRVFASALKALSENHTAGGDFGRKLVDALLAYNEFQRVYEAEENGHA